MSPELHGEVANDVYGVAVKKGLAYGLALGYDALYGALTDLSLGGDGGLSTPARCAEP